MAAQKVDYSKAEAISNDGIRLFKVMMRLEFALKDIGFGKSGHRESAEVDWERYTNEKLGRSFWELVRSSPEVEPLIQTPPQRQVIDQNRALGWKPTGAVSSTQDLIGAMRRVRNNLFHGGKSGDPDADRNTLLYSAALFLADQIILNDDDLQASFSGLY